MRTTRVWSLGIVFVLVASGAACGQSVGAEAGAEAGVDASPGEAGGEADVVSVDASSDATTTDAGDGVCAQTFGSALTADFGRVDGTIRAIVRPGVEGCGPVNGSHLVLQIDVQGAVYRAVINVASNQGDDRRVRLRTVTHALPAPAFAEGWHPAQMIDYVTLLGSHTTDFTPYERDALVAEALRNVRVGARVSVYATSGAGRPDSVHLVHRNPTGHDGAVVLDPQGASPQWLLFHFADQTF